VDFKVKVMEVASPDGKMKRVKVTIWDTGNDFHDSIERTSMLLLICGLPLPSTAGQERFRTLTSSYYRGAQGIILVYDVARKETFDSLSMWLQEVEQFSMGGGKEVVKLLVGNKVDQPRVIQRDVADDWARSRGMLFMEASAKTKEGISQVFIEVVQKVRLLRRVAIEDPSRSPSTLCASRVRSWRTPHCCRILAPQNLEIVRASVARLRTQVQRAAAVNFVWNPLIAFRGMLSFAAWRLRFGKVVRCRSRVVLLFVLVEWRM
jgi:Ras-related protein Rab-18